MFVHAHLATDNARFGIAKDIRAVVPGNPQHDAAAIDTGQPVPVLAEDGVAVSRGLGHDAEGRTAIGLGREPAVVLGFGFIAEQPEGDLVGALSIAMSPSGRSAPSAMPRISSA